MHPPDSSKNPSLLVSNTRNSSSTSSWLIGLPPTACSTECRSHIMLAGNGSILLHRS